MAAKKAVKAVKSHDDAWNITVLALALCVFWAGYIVWQKQDTDVKIMKLERRIIQLQGE